MYEPNNYLSNPATREIQHNPTGACFRYDGGFTLGLLNAAAATPNEIPLIIAGAAEALLQERRRDQSIAFAWADHSGRF
jgi:hypothetical protein